MNLTLVVDPSSVVRRIITGRSLSAGAGPGPGSGAGSSAGATRLSGSHKKEVDQDSK